MKRCFKRLGKAGLAVIFGAIICLSAAGAVFSQSSAQDPVPVLEGLDPVMLVQGKEVQGDAKDHINARPIPIYVCECGKPDGF